MSNLSVPQPKRATNNSILEALQDSETSLFLPHDTTFQLFGQPNRSNSYNSLFSGSGDDSTSDAIENHVGRRYGSPYSVSNDLNTTNLGLTNNHTRVSSSSMQSFPRIIGDAGFNSHDSLVGLGSGLWGSGTFPLDSSGRNDCDIRVQRERSLSDSFGDSTVGLDLDVFSSLNFGTSRPASTPVGSSLDGLINNNNLYGNIGNTLSYKVGNSGMQQQFKQQVATGHYEHRHGSQAADLQNRQYRHLNHQQGEINLLQKSTSAPVLYQPSFPDGSSYSQHHYQHQQHKNMSLIQSQSSGQLARRFPSSHSIQSGMASNRSSPSLDAHSRMLHINRLPPPPAVLFNSSSPSPSQHEDSAEDVVLRNCLAILEDAADHSLKAVELANTLRARIGTDILADIRERWGGLLALLERQQDLFVVRRIPKNDFVCLANSQEGKKLRSLDESANNSGSFSSFENFDDPGNEGQVSRCLHVGNVPSHLTEDQLYVEFERFGELEGLKVVTQRSRRFAFVTFITVEQAINAKQRMTKLGPWKSAISFAHKESITSLSTQPSQRASYPKMKEDHSGAYTRQNDFKHSPTATQHGAYWSNQQYQDEYGHQHNSTMSEDHFSPNTLESRSNGDTSVLQRHHIAHHLQQPQPCPVLQRLCDDTYVPTQPWPVDFIMDHSYCNSVVAQLQQFGGGTSVSKLRGFLRQRICSTDNIKSVPLKAMLTAYPNLFVVRGNHVSLAQHNYPADSFHG